MNKTIKIAIAAAFAMATTAQAIAFGTWSIEAGDAGSVASGGAWFGYDDSGEDGRDGKGGCGVTDFPEGSTEIDVVTEPWQTKGGMVTYTFTDACTYEYPFAGVGFNWFGADGDTKYTIRTERDDPTRGATGIKIKYKLEKEGDAIKRCVVEIGTDDNITGNNNHAAKLDFSGGNTGSTWDYLEAGHEFSFEDDFAPEAGWGTPTTTVEDALDDSEGIKFKCEAGSPSKNATVKLTLKEISFTGSGRESVPILKTPSFAGLSMAQNGRMVSLSVSKAAPVQVINLQGALVHTQTVTPESGNMNLSKLPAGVYMVRVPSLGYANKVMLR